MQIRLDRPDPDQPKCLGIGERNDRGRAFRTFQPERALAADHHLDDVLTA